MSNAGMMKPPVEVEYREELEALASVDTAKKPIGWKLSPQAVRTFILGSRQPVSYNGRQITIQKKYYGNDALIERCIVTLAGNRGLMLVGEPGTAKSMLRNSCRRRSRVSAPIRSREQPVPRRI